MGILQFLLLWPARLYLLHDVTVIRGCEKLRVGETSADLPSAHRFSRRSSAQECGVPGGALSVLASRMNPGAVWPTKAVRQAARRTLQLLDLP